MIVRNEKGQYLLPELPYAVHELEPTIDTTTMEIHHSKHHAAYTNKLNAALEGQPDLQDTHLLHLFDQLDKVPEQVRGAIRNQGGGYYNHCLFWEIMTPGGGRPEGTVAESIRKTFGDLVTLKNTFNQAAETRFGSGWAWIVTNSQGDLCVASTANQDNPLMKGVEGYGGTPILGLDVWEHAYYLRYQNRRPDYIQAWWDVVNWNKVNELLEDALR